MSASEAQVLEQERGNRGSEAGALEAPPPDCLTAAFQLGWRVAELYAQVTDPGEPSGDTLLPGHQSLEPEDQLELQLRAAAGAARRAGIASRAGALEQLISSAHEAPGSSAAAASFRRQVHECHVELSKDLWAREEAAGRAYELGNGMSDTYNRICRSYTAGTEDPREAWKEAFAPGRIERLKKLLDDLQSRLNSAGVAVVRRHLDLWRDAVSERIPAADAPPELEGVRKGLRRQTVIWRQLLAGDKEPEAYLDSEARADLRGDLRDLVWSRCRLWLLPAAAVLFALVFFAPALRDWYERSLLETGIASAVFAVAGAVGITKASMLLTVRTRAKQWSELLWNRAVAERVGAETLVLDDVLPAPAAEAGSLAAIGARLRHGVRKSITSLPGSVAPTPRQGAST